MKNNDYHAWLYRRHLLLKWLLLKWDEILGAEVERKRNPGAFRLIIKTISETRKLFYRLVFTPWCVVNCGSVCCYFSGGKKYGVHLQPHTERAIIKFLAENNMKESKYLSHLTQKLKGKRKSICYAKLNKSRRISKRALDNAPRLLSGERMWVDENSCACSFLGKYNSCLLYSKGVFPGTCTRFVCQTGNAVNVLLHLGYTTPGEVDLKSMRELNSIAEKMNAFFADETLIKLDVRLVVKFQEFVDSFTGGGKGLDKKIKELMLLDSEYAAGRDGVIRQVLS